LLVVYHFCSFLDDTHKHNNERQPVRVGNYTHRFPVNKRPRLRSNG
jgi:hypothetical protein